MEISQSEISSIISDLFLTNEAQKRNKQRYLSLIKNGSYAGLPMLIQALKNIFFNPKTVPQSRLLALHFLQEAVNLNTQQFLLYLKKSLYPLLLEDAKFQKEKKDDDRGKYFFSSTPDATTKTQGNSYLRLLLECIEVWAKWYRQDEVFSQGYIQLSQLGVKFPSERIYLKNINENQKVPLETERGDESDDNEGVLAELVECKVRLRGVLLEKEVDENKLAEIIGRFKVFLDKIELNMFKNKGSKGLDDEKKFLEAVLKAYKYSVKNSERRFEALKESYFLLTGESPPKSHSQILKPRIQIPERSPNSSMNNSSIKKSRQIKLDVQLLRTDLLTTKELLTDNLDKHRKSIRERPETIGPIVDFLIDLLSDSCEKAMTRYLSLFLLKTLMTLETDLLIEPIAIKALPKVIEIAKFNFRSKATDRYCLFFGNTANENIERLADDFVRLAIDCVYCWAKQHPSKSNGSDSIFMESYRYLKELGVSFEGSGMVHSEELENEVVEHNDTQQYDQGFIEEHLKVLNGQMEDLKAFLIKTKKTIKDPNFLPNMLEILLNEQEIIEKIPFSTSSIKEAEGFINEFRKRFKKLEGGMINYTQFKKRFLKLFGIADGISSKISSKSKMSTSDMTMEKEKPEKNGNNGNRNQDLADRQAVFMKISQKNVLKEIDIIEDDIFADFSKTSIISQENIKGYFQLLVRDPKKNLEILAFCAKPIFEDPETHYIEKLNYLNLLRKCVDSSDISIIQFIHDYLMRSLVLAIFNANFSKSPKTNAQIQEEFRLIALESLRDWGLKYKQNITLGNFKKCWDLLVEELMIEVPDRFYEKSSVLLDPRKKSGNSVHLNINFEKSYRFSKDSITLNGMSMNKESAQIPEFHHDKSKGIEEILDKLNKDSATIKEKVKISFSIIFSNDKEKIPLKGFSFHSKNINGNMKNSNINRFFKNDQKVSLEAKLIKENFDLKSQIQKKDAHKLMLEKELKALKERLKILEKNKVSLD